MYNAKAVGVLVVGIAALLACVGMVAIAEGDLDVTIGGESTILPNFTSDIWVAVDWSLDGLSIASTTALTVFPMLATDEILTVEYGFNGASLGATVFLSLYPFSFDGFTLFVDVPLVNATFGDDGALSLDVGLWAPILPSVDVEISADLAVSIWIFSLWSNAGFDVLTQALDAQIGVEIQLLDLAFDNGDFAACWGAELDVLPALDAAMWFEASLSLGDLTIASLTDFDLMPFAPVNQRIDVEIIMGDIALSSRTDLALAPFGLTQQRFDISLDVDALSIYVWFAYFPTANYLATIGFTYDLP